MAGGLWSFYFSEASEEIRQVAKLALLLSSPLMTYRLIGFEMHPQNTGSYPRRRCSHQAILDSMPERQIVRGYAPACGL